MVFIIHIKNNPAEKYLQFEAWRMQIRLGVATRNSPPGTQVATGGSSFKVYADGRMAPPNGVLRMAYQEVFDNPPPAGVGAHIVMPTVEIQTLARECFAQLN